MTNVQLWRKRPVVIRALEYKGDNFEEVLEFTKGTAYDNNGNTCMIPTLEGKHIATKGDYIVEGVHGELYPCKPDIFHKTYQKEGECFMTKNKKMTLGELELRDLVDLGLRMPDGSTELFEVMDVSDHSVVVMTKNIVDFMSFNAKENKHSGNANSYTQSSIRSYLKGLYQTVIEENELLENYTIGNKEFFLVSSFNLGLMSGRCGWQAFKEDESRVKYPGAFAVTRCGALRLDKSEWYWTSTPTATSASSVRYVDADGTLVGGYACDGNLGVAPALFLHTSTPVAYVEGVWHLYDDSSVAFNDKGDKITIGDWVEVTHTVGADIQNGILLGDCFEVTRVKADGNLIVKLPSAEIWCLLLDQVRKIEPPLPHYKKSKETADFNERLKGYYQHTAIEALKVYHTAHKAKEERTKALNKVIENIQELIKLENE